MEQVFNHLTIWLAPILCFTAEEAWLARFGETADSVHLQTFPTVPLAWQNSELLGARWSEIRKLRRVVTGAMELARNEKKIGSSLQAHATLYFSETSGWADNWKALLADLNLPELFISSGVTIMTGALPADAFTILADMPETGVVITLAEGKKCERCWQILPEVGSKPSHPDLCIRCDDAVTNGRKAAA